MTVGIVVAGGALLAILGAIAVIDLRTRRIPDPLNVALALSGLAAALVLDGQVPWPSLLAATVVGAALWIIAEIFRRRRGLTGLGLGDIKMIAAAALWVSPWNLPLVLVVATVGALVAVGVGAVAGRRTDRLTRIPFGPFIGLGLMLTWILERSGLPMLAPAGVW
ncbi:A24 family peptidase [uncultured Jannaschia sp.]|uniref:prepilin peptidase n=1 Tax=uncultured Jannaschia sp. TaxID=293347 RepID=UPI00262DCC25|nr:A24 family peptidase [uncultured Jannaschia sp.]